MWKQNMYTWFLDILIHHHAGVDGGNIWSRKIMSRIFVGDNNFVDIVHRINGNVLSFFSDCIAELGERLKRVLIPFRGYGSAQLFLVNGDGAAIICEQSDILQITPAGAGNR